MKCIQCNKIKDISSFYKNGGGRNGYRRKCKNCLHIQGMDYYHRNQELCNKKRREYNKRNYVMIHATRDNYRYINRERERELGRIWAKKHLEDILKKRKIWRSINPQKYNTRKKLYLALLE